MYLEGHIQPILGRTANWTLRILLVLVAVFGVKSYIMASMGDAAYNARMAELQAGDQYHKIAFAVMRPDPLSAKLKGVIENSGLLPDKPAVIEEPAVATTDTAAEVAVAPEIQEADSTVAEPASGSSNSEVTPN